MVSYYFAFQWLKKTEPHEGIMNHDRGVITMMMLIKEAVKNYIADFFRFYEKFIEFPLSQRAGSEEWSNEGREKTC